VVIDNLMTGRVENVADRIRFVHMDVNSDGFDAFMDAERFDVVNHHAAHMELRVSVERPLMDAETNIIGSLRLLEACRRTGVQHVVLASTGGGIYGEQDYYPADEDHPARPMAPYGVAKRAMELYADYYRAAHGLSITTLRYTNVYGPRQNPFGEAGVIAIFLNKWMEGVTPVVNGDGAQTRDYIHVADVAAANIIVTDRRLQGTYNCSTAIETTLNDVIAIMQGAVGGVHDVVHGPAKAGDLRRNVCTAERLHRATGWTPLIDVATGIAHTTQWFVARGRRG
jgi:UDP-glucose 4-epimerase